MRGPCLYFNLFDNKPTFVKDCCYVDHTTSPSQSNITPINDCNYLDIKINFNEPTYYYPYLITFLTNKIPDKVLHMDFGFWIYKRSQWTRKDFDDTNSGVVEQLEYEHFQLMIDLFKTVQLNNGQYSFTDLLDIEIMHRGFKKPTDAYLIRWRSRIMDELFALMNPGPVNPTGIPAGTTAQRQGTVDITHLYSAEFVSMDPTIPHRLLYLVNTSLQQRIEVKDVNEYGENYPGGIP